MRDKAQWEQIITLIHKVEDRYGSIHNTPRSDPDFKDLQELCGVTHANHINSLTGMSASKVGMIISKIAQGHTKRYIIKHCHVKIAVLDQIAATYAVHYIPPFHYILHKDGEKDFYFRSKLIDIPLYFNLSNGNSYQVKRYVEYLKENGWTLTYKKTIWDQIPIGAKFISKHHDEVLTKYTEEYDY